jgi:hypothetical protein
MTDDIKTVWKTQKTEDTVTLDNIHDRAARFQRRVSFANAIEYAAAAVVVAIFGLYVWLLPGWMMKTGSALIIVATFYIMSQLRRRGSARNVPESATAGLIDFHRQALERRRDLNRSAWHWYILPVIPGIALITLGRWFQAHPAGRPVETDRLIIVLCLIIVALIIGVIRLGQILAAAKLQRQIEELERLK